MRKLSLTRLATVLAVFAASSLTSAEAGLFENLQRGISGGVPVSSTTPPAVKNTVKNTKAKPAVKRGPSDLEIFDAKAKKAAAKEKKEVFGVRTQEDYAAEIYDVYVKRPYAITWQANYYARMPVAEQKKFDAAVADAAQKFIAAGCAMPTYDYGSGSKEKDDRPAQSCIPLVVMGEHTNGLDPNVLIPAAHAQNPKLDLEKLTTAMKTAFDQAKFGKDEGMIKRAKSMLDITEALRDKMRPPTGFEIIFKKIGARLGLT